MKKLNDLYQERADLIEKMNALTENDEMSEDQEREWNETSVKVEKLNSDIKRAEKQENLNLLISKKVEAVKEEEAEERSLVDGLQEFFRSGVAPEEFRGPQGGFLLPWEARDVLTTTKLGSANVNKTVADELSIAKTPAQMVLDKLGVTMYTGLNGQFVVPSMAQVSAGFVSETVAVADASAAPAALTLSPRRLGAYNTVTRETLVSSNPAIWNGIIQDIFDAWKRAQVADLFDQIQTDCVDSSTTIAGSTLAYADLVQLQANVPYDMANPVYVTTPAIAAYLKKTASIASVAGPIWEGPIMNGTIDGIPAIGTSLANTDALLYFDGPAAVIGEWGAGVELLLNPYDYDVEGEVKVVISGMTDTGFKNYRFCSFIPDVSI